MSPESQRVALAELCPKAVLFRNGVPYWRNRYEYTESSCAVSLVEFDPLEDMNAIHEVIMNLPSDGSWTRFLIELENALNCAGQPSSTYQFMMVNASAEKRCVAILKACGKWVEAK